MPNHEGYIASAANLRVKAWAKLTERKHREREGKFLLEGVHLVKEALLAGWPLECVAYDAGAGVPAELAAWAEADAGVGVGNAGELEEAGQSADLARSSGAARRGPAWIPVSPEVIAKCSQSETPQPVFAVAMKRAGVADLTREFGMTGRQLNDRTSEAGPGRDRKPVGEAGSVAQGNHSSGAAAPMFDPESALVVVLDGVQDPGNVGTIVRSAAACGATAVVLGRGTADICNAKTLRATMGALFHVPVIEADLTELLPQAVESGIVVVGTSLQAARSCYECDFRRGVWLVFGNEGSGMSAAVSGSVSEHVIIPMTGHAESLNVAMAATVLLFEAQRQRMDESVAALGS